jgi:hypothetical protein
MSLRQTNEEVKKRIKWYCEAPHPQGRASPNLILNFRYMPLDHACKAGLAKHETGQQRMLPA